MIQLRLNGLFLTTLQQFVATLTAATNRCCWNLVTEIRYVLGETGTLKTKAVTAQKTKTFLTRLSS